MDTASSCLLNICVQTQTQELLSALIREASFAVSSQSWAAQGARKSEVFSPERASGASFQGSGGSTGDDGTERKPVMRRNSEKRCFLDSIRSLPALTHSSHGCQRWACVSLGLATVSHGWRWSQEGLTAPSGRISVSGWVLKKEESLSSIVKPLVGPVCSSEQLCTYAHTNSLG